jgi:heat shock protein HtpX
MNGLKRIAFFLLLNALVVMMLSVILSLIKLPSDQVYSLLIICVLFGFSGSFISLLISKKVAKVGYKIQLIDPQTASGKALMIYETIRGMAEYQRIKMPEVGIYPSKDVNAFATGASRNSSLIAFSSAMLDTLSEEEIAAVAGHELTHIIQGDMVSMTLIMGLVNTFVMFLARIVAFALDAAMRDSRGRGGLGYFGYYMVVILLQNVLLLLAMIPTSYYSRYREYRADKGAAELTNPAQMSHALEKVNPCYYPDPQGQSFAMAKINNRKTTSIFATHPPMANRIAKLKEMM